MLADEVLDLCLGALIKRVIGGAPVGEFGIGAPRRDDAPGKDRIFGRDGAERAVRMSQPLAELEEPHAVLGR